ncbi:ABC transporter permease [Paenibacillus swuensis]|uniref:ABC transporter permease n=1 Tax=Paenibacillus swuensis TaxID=1178515 RepID=A0A172TPS5_9BACL|nr:ABC transporter permease [Paenibacillus swuensis]
MIDGLLYAFLAALSLLVIVPFGHLLAVSLSPAEYSLGGNFFLIPKDFTLEAYKYLLTSSDRFLIAIKNTVYLTVLGTIVNLAVSITLAYGLSKKFLPGRSLMLLLIFFTMIFSAGLIPTYLLVQSLGLLDTYWAIILPGATNAFTVFVMKTFFQGLPESLDEAARIDGAGEVRILLAVVIPLSMPIIATFSLFFMVGHWNQFFQAILYMSDSDKWPIQVLLRQMILSANASIGAEVSSEAMEFQIGNNVKMAAVILALVPIVLVYPFLQKYFASGALLGSVKE